MSSLYKKLNEQLAILREYIGIRRRGLIAQKPHAWAIARMRITGKIR